MQRRKEHYVKSKIDWTQQFTKCKFYGNSLTQLIINKLFQQTSTKKYMTRLGLAGEAIRRELCKKLKFDHTTKWYILEAKSVQKNKTHKILSDFEIQIYNLIQARRLDLISNKIYY